MDDMDAFIGFLREEEVRSYDTVLDDERAIAIDCYEGKPYGNEEPGRSQVVTRDVAQTINHTVISILKTMISTKKAVEFEHADAKVAEQATMAVSRTFLQGMQGYMFLHSWIKAGLLEKASIAKTVVEKVQPKREEKVVPVEVLALLQQEQEANPDGPQIVAAEPMDESEAEWKIAIAVPQPPRFRDYVSPNENTSFAQDANDLDDDCVYVGFHEERTLSWIAQNGFATDDIADDSGSNLETTALWNARNGEQYNRNSYNRSGVNRKVIFHEEYVRYDLNGDGIAELLLVHRVGNTILTKVETGELSIEEVDEQPGVSWCPFPMQHRIVGQSLADQVMDIQVENTFVMRQTFDGFAFANNPRTFLNEQSIGDNTIDDLLTVRAGGIVRYTGLAKPEIVTNSFDIASSVMFMEKLTAEKESRTGITRLNQGLEADAIRNDTAAAFNGLQDAGKQIEEYLARNFAEPFARLMLKKYRLMRKFGRPFDMVIDGETVVVDPQQWPDDMDVIVNVGLGTGRKDQRIAFRSNLLEINAAALQQGSRLFSEENTYNNIKGLIADMALGSVRELVTDPATLGDAPEKPDPKMLEAQAKAEIAAADQDRKAEEARLTLQLKREEATAKIDLMREEAAEKLRLERERAEFEAALAVDQQQFEMQQAREQMALQREQAEHKASVMEQQAVAKNRPGGDLDK